MQKNVRQNSSRIFRKNFSEIGFKICKQKISGKLAIKTSGEKGEKNISRLESKLFHENFGR